MENDDAPVGRVLSRREVLTLFGIGGAGLLGVRALNAEAIAAAPRTAPGWLPACVVRPEQMEGPYFVDEKLNRTDIRADPTDGSVRQGTPLDVELRLTKVVAGNCMPLVGATVDLWQCDAVGVYSDVVDFQGKFDTRGKKFLRGLQVSDATGLVRFHTIYPGWYEGRAVHLHVKVRTPVEGGKHHDFTSQLYFDEAHTEAVYARAPYSAKRTGWLRNAQDDIFRSGGTSLLLDLSRKGNGYVGKFDLGVDLTA
ncbi:MAG: twin-arginine translocation pathway signal protein [Gemmatimonadaceae bacterium]|nr:twin-arginine translocation pathway signal protein [Gemmatimonadaceae bacterium]